MEETYLKEKINLWLSEEENVRSIRNFLKSLILKKVVVEDERFYSNLKNRNYDLIDVSLIFLIIDFFLRNHFHYGLSVFSSEVLSTSLKDYFCDFMNKISYKWDPGRPPTLDYTTVCDILLSLGENPSSALSVGIIEKYYLKNEGSLLQILLCNRKPFFNQLSEMKKLGSENRLFNQNYSRTSYPRNYKKIRKDTIQLQQKICLQKRDLAIFKDFLSTYKEALNRGLKRAQIIVKDLRQFKNDIILELHMALNAHKEFVNNIHKALSCLNYIGNSKVYESQVSCNTDESCQKCQKKINANTSSCPEEYTVDHEGTKLGDHDMVQNASTQTYESEYSYLKMLEEEKMELICFIDQQQERINTLTEKTLALDNIVKSSKKIGSESIEPIGVSFIGSKNLQSENNNNTFEQNQKIETVIGLYDFCIKSAKIRLKFLKNQFDEAEAKYAAFSGKDKLL